MAKKTPSVTLSDVQGIVAGDKSGNPTAKAPLQPLAKADALTPAAMSKAQLLAAAKKKLAQEALQAEEAEQAEAAQEKVTDELEKAEELADRPLADVILAQATTAPAVPSAGGSSAPAAAVAAPAAAATGGVSMVTVALAGLGLAAVAGGGGGGGSSAAPAPAPSPAVISGKSADSVTETDAVLTASGKLTATDVDSSAAFTAQTDVAGNNGYGKFSIDAAGNWTYTANSAHDEFAKDQNYTDSITVATADGTTKIIVVTYTGTNDAAVITGSSVASITETNAVLEASGSLSATDVDSATTFVAQTNVAGSNAYGKFTISANGAWTYTANSAHNEFAKDQTYTDSITVAAADGTTQIITVTYTGTNDAPVANAVSGGGLAGDKIIIAPDASDVDATDTLTYTITQAPTGGTVAVVGGKFEYTPTGTFSGNDFFIYQADDGNGGVKTARADVKVDYNPNFGRIFTLKADASAIELTPTANNDITVENTEFRFTTRGDDTIIAPRLDILDKAYIDGGVGYNVLEVDALGAFAKPVELLRIQEIIVNNTSNEGAPLVYADNTQSATHAAVRSNVRAGTDDQTIESTTDVESAKAGSNLTQSATVSVVAAGSPAGANTQHATRSADTANAGVGEDTQALSYTPVTSNGVADSTQSAEYSTVSAAAVGVHQLDFVTIEGVIEAGDVFSITINGSTFRYTAALGDDADNVADGLVSKINENLPLAVTASNGGPGIVSLLADAANQSFTGRTAATNREPVAQVGEVEIDGSTIEAGDVFTITINSTTFSHTATAQDTARTIRDDLIAQVMGDPVPVLASAGGDGIITLTAVTAGVPFTASTATTNAVATRQVDDITISGAIEAGDVFTVTVNSTEFSHTAAAGESANDVRDALIAAVNVGAEPVTASAGGAGVLTLTAAAAGTLFAADAGTVNVAAVAQENEVTIGGVVQTGDVFTVTVNGTKFSHTATVGQSAEDVRNALVEAVNGGSEPVTATAGAADVLVLTADAAGTGFTVTAAAANVSGVAQVDSVLIGANVDAGDVFTVTINSTNFSHTATRGETADDVRNALIQLVNADSVLAVTATDGGSRTLELTADVPGTAFTATSRASNAAAVAQVATVTIGGAIDVGDEFSVTINGVLDFTHTAGQGETAIHIRDALINQINAADVGVTATSGADGVITLTANTAGTAFSVSSSTTNLVIDSELNDNSVLDVSRATDLEKLVITEGTDGNTGSLLVTGIRNDAVARFEGSFTQDVTLDYGQGSSNTTAPVIELVVGNVSSQLSFIHNSGALTLASLGGESNTFDSDDTPALGNLSTLNIIGNAALNIMGDLDASFVDGVKATIDAHLNEGGVSLKLTNEKDGTPAAAIHFVGSKGNDTVELTTDDYIVVDAGAGDNRYNLQADRLITVNGGANDGDNVITVTTADAVSITMGDGTNEYWVHTGSIDSVKLVAGNGANTLQVEASNLDVELGDGKNWVQFNNQDSEEGTISLTAGNGGNYLDLANGSPSNTATVVTGTGDDYIRVEADTASINAGAGTNTIDATGDTLSVVAGDGKNIISATANVELTLTAGDGANKLDIFASEAATLTLGNGVNTVKLEGTTDSVVVITTGTGNNTLRLAADNDDLKSVNVTTGIGNDVIEAWAESEITINAGAGNNTIYADSQSAEVEPAINITTSGAGSSDIEAYGGTVVISTGSGKDVIEVSGSAITITGVAGDKTVTLADGINNDYLAEGGVSLNLNLGTGNSTVAFGSNPIIAAQDSVIAGTNVTLFVDTTADLQAATLTGVKSVVLDDNAGEGKAVLTLTAAQFKAITLAEGFKVEGSVFHTNAIVKIIVSETTSLTALGADTLPRNIDLQLEIQDGVTLTMTAQQLHERVDQEGVTLADDGTDLPGGKIIITGAGLAFNPWEIMDSNVSLYEGGSLGSEFDINNVTIKRSLNAYNRPADAANTDIIEIDSTGLSPELVVDGFETMSPNLSIFGDKNVRFTSAVDLGDDFTVDFSQLTGELKNLTIANFQDVKQIRGNGDDATVFVQVVGVEDGDGGEVGGEIVGGTERAGLVTSGVSHYMVTAIADDDSETLDDETAFIYLGANSQDIETLGLRGNDNATIEFMEVSSGIEFVMEGDGTVLARSGANGSTASSNIGTLVVQYADYEENNAAALVHINNQGVDLTTRHLHADGVRVHGAKSVSLDIKDGDIVIDEVFGNDLTSLHITAEQDVSIGSLIGLTEIDASGVVGSFSASFDPASDFSFEGAVGGSELTLTGSPFNATSDTHINGGSAGVDLILTNDTDLSAAALTHVDSITVGEDKTLTLSQAQWDVTPQLVAQGEGANLVIENFGAAPTPTHVFNAAALQAAGFDVYTITMASGTHTLNPLINLEGVGEIEVAKGGTLTLTAAQFQQLDGLGAIDCSLGGATVNITGLTQAQVDAGFDLSGISGTVKITVALAESVDFVGSGVNATVLGSQDPTFILGTHTLGVATEGQANGLNATGSTGSTIEVLFSTSTGSIDASGYAVDKLKLPNVLVDNNADFTDLAGSVETVIYNIATGLVEIDRVYTVQASTVIPGDYELGDNSAESVVVSLTLNLQGGSVIDGDVHLHTSEKDPSLTSDVTVVQGYLETVTINSTGASANVIGGALQPEGSGDEVDNNLLSVTINAAQALSIEGGIVFNSVTVGDFDDGIVSNDNFEAVAELTVTGAANVNVGVLNTSDVDVVGLNVVNSGSGTLSLTMESTYSADDALSFTGGHIALTLNGDFDLTSDVTTGVSRVTITGEGDVTMTHAQFALVGEANFSSAAADVYLTNFGADSATLFDASAVDSDIDLHITMAAGVHTLNPAINLKDVVELNLASTGGTLTLTAAQFLQLADEGTIDANGGTVNITGLTQAQIDGGFDLSSITGEKAVTLSLAENVNLDEGNNFGDAADVAKLEIILAAGQTLGVPTHEMADGLNVTGAAGSMVSFLFRAGNSGDADGIDVSGYKVTTLQVLNVYIDGVDIEAALVGLPSGVELSVYNDLTGLVEIDRIYTVQAGTTVPGEVIYNDASEKSVVVSLELNLEGGARIEGDMHLVTSDKDAGYSVPGNDLTVIQTYLKTITINSTGTAANTLNGETDNVITGVITPHGEVDQVSNNLQTVVIHAAQGLVIEGGIVFNSVTNDDFDDGVTANDNESAVASLTVDGTANVNVGVLDTQDTDVDSLHVVNSGTGTLSVTLDSVAVPGNDALSFTGGHIALTIDGDFDLTDDVTSGLSHVKIEEESATVIMTHAQVAAVGVANFSTDGSSDITLNLTEFGADADDLFDASVLAANGISVDVITMAAGVHTLNPLINLSGVGMIMVPDHGTLTLTAAQFQQLADGEINGADITINITGLTQAQVDAGFDLTNIQLTSTSHVTITLAEDVHLIDSIALNGTQLCDVDHLEFILAAGQTLGLSEISQVSPSVVDGLAAEGTGITITGGANSTVVFQFVDGFNSNTTVDASGINVSTLKLLNTLVDDRDVELLQNIDSDVTVRVFADPSDLDFATPIYRHVVIEADVTVDGDMVFNSYQADTEVVTLDLTLSGGVTIAGDLRLTAVDSGDNLARHFQTLTINSEGATANVITGDISPIDANDDMLGAIEAIDNNLLEVIINADQALNITGSIVFNSVGNDGDDNATLSINGSDDVTIAHLDTAAADGEGDGIATLKVVNNSTGTLTVTGGSPALEAGGSTENLVFEGSGDIVFGTTGHEGITSASLSSVDASELTGDLTMGLVTDVDGDFSFTSGSGKTVLTFEDSGLSTALSFDLSAAGEDSALHLNAAFDDADTGSLSIDLGSDATLYIDSDMDLSSMTLSIDQVNSIVLGRGVNLTLTAEQADGLTIVSASGVGPVGTVDIVELGNTVVDLSGIETAIAGQMTLEDDDVALATATDLGDFSLMLESRLNSGTSGQTIRFATQEQAALTIDVTDADGSGTNSSNVVWLFGSVTSPVNTNNYSANLGRLWISQDLANGDGVNPVNMEDIFTSLPLAIIRTEFTSIEALDLLLLSSEVHRTVEYTAFTELENGVVFNDINDAEYVRTLTLNLGGEVKLGNLIVGESIDTLEYEAVTFDLLTINSELALTGEHPLAPEAYANDNDGINESGEFAQPDALNTIGDISVGNGTLGLLNVVINTGAFSVLDNESIGAGAAITIGTIYYDSALPESVATLVLTGDNNVTIESLDTGSDSDVAILTINAFDLTADLEITGGSPAAAVDNAETLNIITAIDAFGAINFGTAVDANDDPYAGVAGAELSDINITGNGEVNLGIVALIDSTDFSLQGNENTTLTLGTANVNGVLTAPALASDGEWSFTDADLTITEDVVLGAGTLHITGGVLTIVGVVDFSTLDELDLTDVRIELANGAELTILAEDADGLTITGAGTVNVTDLEDTPDADLSFITTTDVFATIDTGAVSNLVTITANFGTAEVTVSGAGTADVTGAVPVTMLDAVAFVVSDATATLVMRAHQADGRTVTGAGDTDVQDIGAAENFNTAIDLSGVVTTAGVHIAVDTDCTLTSAAKLGAAGATRVITIGADVELRVAGSVVDGQYIDGTDATLLVDDDNPGAITADLSHVTADNINLVGDAIAGTITFPVLDDTQTVLMNAAQANEQVITGANSNADGTVVVSDLGSGATDLSHITVGSMTAHVPFTAELASSTDLGGFDVVLHGTAELTLTAAQAEDRSITEEAAGDNGVTVTHLEDTPGADLSGIVMADEDGEAAELDADGSIVLSAKLGDNMHVAVDNSGDNAAMVNFTGEMDSTNTEFDLVGNDVTLVLDAQDADDLTVFDNANDTAVVVNNLGSDQVDFTRMDADSLTANVSDDAALDAGTLLGGFDVVLATDADLTLTAEQASGRAITEGATGTSSVTVTDLEDTLNADLSAIVMAGSDSETAELDADGGVTLSANLGSNMHVNVSNSGGNPATVNLTGAMDSANTEFDLNGDEVTLVLDAEDADDLTVFDNAADTAVVVNNLGSAQVDFTAINADSLTANVSEDATLDAGTLLAGFNVVLANTVDLTLTAAQATGRAITEGGTNATVTVTALEDTLDADLSAIVMADSDAETAELDADGNVTLSANLSTNMHVNVSNSGSDLATVTFTGDMDSANTEFDLTGDEVTLVLDAQDADDLTVFDSGEDTAVVVNNLGSAQVDFTSMSADSLTANVSEDTTLDADTLLGGFDVVLASAVDLTLTAAQASGRAITESATGTSSVTVNNLEDALSADLSRIVMAGSDSETVNLDASVDRALAANLGANMHLDVTNADNLDTTVTFTGLMVSEQTEIELIGGDITLVLDAADADQLTVIGNTDTAVIVNNLGADEVDFTNIVADSLIANVFATATLDADTLLGGFDVVLNSDSDLTLTAAQATGRGITEDEGEDNRVVVTDLEDTLDADLSGIVMSGEDGEVAELDANGDVELSADLGADMRVVVGDSLAGDNTVTFTGEMDSARTQFDLSADGVTLVLDAADADDLTVYDFSADTAVIVNNLGSAQVDFTNINADTLTANVASDATLDEDTLLAGFDVVLADATALTLTAEQATGRDITEANSDQGASVMVTDLEGQLDADLSGIVMAGSDSETVELWMNGDKTFTGDLGENMLVEVRESEGDAYSLNFAGQMDSASTEFDLLTDGAGLVLLAADADDLTVFDSADNTSVRVYNLSTPQVDFTAIAADTLTAYVSDDARLDEGTLLGDFDVSVYDNAALTLTAAQATGRSVTELNVDAGASVSVRKLEETLDADLSGVVFAGDVLESASINVEGEMTFTGNLGEDMNVYVFDNDDLGGTMTFGSDAEMDSASTTFILRSDVTLVFDAGDAHLLTVEDGAGAGGVVVNDVDGDLLDFRGMAAPSLTANVAETVTLNSDTELGNFDVVLADGVTLTLTIEQLLSVGEADFSGSLTPVPAIPDPIAPYLFSDADEDLVVTGYTGQELDSSLLGEGIVISKLVLQPGATVVVDPDADLSRVLGFEIPAGTTLTLTIEQFKELGGKGFVTGAGTLNITGLSSNDPSIDFSGVDDNVAGDITLDDGEDVIVLNADANLSGFGILMSKDGQSLTLASETQADGRSIDRVDDGIDDITLVLGFSNATSDDADANLDAADYLVDHIKVLNEYVFNEFGLDQETNPVNEETFLADMSDSVIDVTYYDKEELAADNLLPAPGGLVEFDRTVVIEAETTVNRSLSFNPDATRELHNLTLNLEGNAVLTGSIILAQDKDPQDGLPNNVPSYFDTLTINSYDVSDEATDINEIRGNIFADDGTDGAESRVEVFTLTIGEDTLIDGVEDWIQFDGQVVDLSDADDASDVALAMANGVYNNWTATAEGNVVTFTNKYAGDVTDVSDGDFKVQSNNVESVIAIEIGDVVTTTQGEFSGRENNLRYVDIVVDHDLNIGGEIEFRYITQSNSARDAKVYAGLDVDGEYDLTIGSIDTEDEHIDALDIDLSDFTGVLSVTGNSPALAVDNTETVTISDSTGKDWSYAFNWSSAADPSGTITVDFMVNGVAYSKPVDIGGFTPYGGEGMVFDMLRTELATILGSSFVPSDVAYVPPLSIPIVVGTPNTYTVTPSTGYTFKFLGSSTDTVSNLTMSYSLSGESGSVNLGSSADDEGGAHAGVSGNTLSLLDANDFYGDLDLGVVSMVDSDNDGDVAAFTFDSGSGLTTMTMGAVEGEAPTLAAGSTWMFNYSDAGDNSSLTLADGVVLESGSTLVFEFSDSGDGSMLIVDTDTVSYEGVTLDLNHTEVHIRGNVDWSGAILDIEGSEDIYVEAGATLTLTLAQVQYLQDNDIYITGSGTTALVGDATVDSSGVSEDEQIGYDITDGLESTFTFGEDYHANILTVGLDLSGLTLEDSDDTQSLVSTFIDLAEPDFGSSVLAALPPFMGYSGRNITGTHVNDVVVALPVSSPALAFLQYELCDSDFDTVSVGNYLDDTFTLGKGDDVVLSFLGNDTYNVDSGSDVILNLKTLVIAQSDAECVIESKAIFSDVLTVSKDAQAPVYETFTLNLSDDVTITGAADVLTFAGVDFDVTSDDTADTIAAKLAEGDYVDWTASVGADGRSVTFVATSLGNKQDVTMADLSFGSDANNDLDASTLTLDIDGVTAYGMVNSLQNLFADLTGCDDSADTVDESADILPNFNTGIFVATSATVNNGHAVLIGGNDDNTIIDMTLAGGTEGFTLVGGADYTFSLSPAAELDAVLNSDGYGDNFDLADVYVSIAEELAEGYGGSSDTGVDVLIGSANNDIIMGGNDMQETSDSLDILTGNHGADQFVFNAEVSTAVSFGVTGSDEISSTIITVTPDGVEAGTEYLSFSYTLDGVPGTLTVVASDANFDSLSLLGGQVAALLDAVTGISASYCDTDLTDLIPGQITVRGENGAELLFVDNQGSGDRGDVLYGPGTNTLQAVYGVGDTIYSTQIATLGDITSDSTEHVGETYGLDITIDGSTYNLSHVVAAGDTTASILADLLDQFSDDIGSGFGTEWTGSVVGDTLTITDLGASDSDLQVEMDYSAGGYLGGTGASMMNDNGEDGIAGTSDDGGIDLATADIITDFETGVDKIVMRGMDDGSLSNYSEDIGHDTYDDALAAANAAFDGSGGTMQYFLTSADGTYTASFSDATPHDPIDYEGLELTPPADCPQVIHTLSDYSGLTFASDDDYQADVEGLLFFDANMDGVADGVINLVGISASNFSYSDIIGAITKLDPLDPNYYAPLPV